MNNSIQSGCATALTGNSECRAVDYIITLNYGDVAHGKFFVFRVLATRVYSA